MGQWTRNMTGANADYLNNLEKKEQMQKDIKEKLEDLKSKISNNEEVNLSDFYILTDNVFESKDTAASVEIMLNIDNIMEKFKDKKDVGILEMGVEKIALTIYGNIHNHQGGNLDTIQESMHKLEGMGEHRMAEILRGVSRRHVKNKMEHYQEMAQKNYETSPYFLTNVKSDLSGSEEYLKKMFIFLPNVPEEDIVNLESKSIASHLELFEQNNISEEIKKQLIQSILNKIEREIGKEDSVKTNEYGLKRIIKKIEENNLFNENDIELKKLQYLKNKYNFNEEKSEEKEQTQEQEVQKKKTPISKGLRNY